VGGRGASGEGGRGVDMVAAGGCSEEEWRMVWRRGQGDGGDFEAAGAHVEIVRGGAKGKKLENMLQVNCDKTGKTCLFRRSPPLPSRLVHSFTSTARGRLLGAGATAKNAH
jgi:hypothetical protein